MEIQKEYLDLNDNFSYHKASAADWRGIGYTEIPTGADIFFMEWFYKETQEGGWLVWDKHQDCWKPCDYDFREGCPNIHWKREGVTLKKAVVRSISNQNVPEGFVLVKRELSYEDARKQAESMFSKVEPIARNEQRDLSDAEFETFKNRWLCARTKIIQFDWKTMVEAQDHSHD